MKYQSLTVWKRTALHNFDSEHRRPGEGAPLGPFRRLADIETVCEERFDLKKTGLFDFRSISTGIMVAAFLGHLRGRAPASHPDYVFLFAFLGGSGKGDTKKEAPSLGSDTEEFPGSR